jgi:hypothetical protein
MPGTNVGFGGIWQPYKMMPVSWQGWLVTLVYVAVQITAAWLEITFLGMLTWILAWVMAQVFILHLVYLWVASRHYVTWDELAPSGLPADMRNGTPND